MGKYFADVHASHESQFQGLPHGLADTDEIRVCRAKPQTYENLLELADALCWQLRFREAIDALTQAVKLAPERMETYRKRGPKYLDTLQFERALADYTRCEQADGVSVESRYRVGMAQYMLQNYDAATAAFAGSLAIVPQDDDMYIADVYWLVLSQLRAEKADEAQKTLKQHYRPDMYVGHHTAYEKAMRVAAAGFAPMEDMLAELETTLEGMDLGPLLGLWLQSSVIGLTMQIMGIIIFVLVYGRMIEIYLMTSLASLPVATLSNRELGGTGQNYLKSLFAVGFQGMLILVCVAIYAVLIQGIATGGDPIGAIWGTVGYTVLLCFMLFKTGGIAQRIFGAH